MTLSVRLPPEERLALERYCRERGVSKTEVVLRLLREHVLPRKTPMQIAEEMGIIGAWDGPGDLSRDHSRYLKEKLRKDHARRYRTAHRPLRSK